MTWEFSHHEYEVFKRNPLRETNVEIKFHPIVAISENRGKLANFQDLVREEFPIFAEGVVKNVTLDVAKPGGVHVADEKVLTFERDDHSQRINLSATSLLLSTLDHKNRGQLTSTIEHLVKCFQEVYGRFSPLRLGVRYINVVKLGEVSSDCGGELSWEDLINESYLHYPAQLKNRLSTFSKMELRTSIANDVGELILFYGMNLKEKNVEPEEYVFDIDRYVEMPSPSDIVMLVDKFSLEIYSIFLDMAAPKLVEWMRSA